MSPEQAIRESIRAYYRGESFSSFTKERPFKYDKGYFDKMEEDLLEKTKDTEEPDLDDMDDEGYPEGEMGEDLQEVDFLDG